MLLGVVVEVALGGTWLAIGLAASVRDAVQPWAGRVAPLYASLGLVELLNALDQLRPGTWALPSSALLASVAMITAHSAYVDLLDSTRLVASVDHRTRQLSGCPHPAATSPAPSRSPTSTSPRWSPPPCALVEAGQEVRVRGGVGVATPVPATWPRPWSGCSPTRRPTRRQPGHRARRRDRRTGRDLGDRPWPGHVRRVDARRAVARPARGARALMARNGGGLELRNRIGGTTFVLVLPAAEDQRTEVIVPRWDSVTQSA